MDLSFSKRKSSKNRQENKPNPLTDPLGTLKARDEDIDEAYASARLYREMAKSILLQNAGKRSLSHFEKNNLTRCLKRAAESEQKAKRKEVSAATIRQIMNIGEEATHTANLAKVIAAQTGLTKSKIKMAGKACMNKAVKRMEKIVTEHDKDKSGYLMEGIGEIMSIDPALNVLEAHSGLTDKNSAEEDILADIMSELDIEEPSMAAEAVMRCDKTKPVELPEGLTPVLPDLPVSAIADCF